MASFASLAETRRLGAPVVRLFRAALGRDPDPAGLLHFADRLRQGAELRALAREIAASPEFQLRHGPDAPPDERFAERILGHCLPEGPVRDSGRASLRAAMAAGADRAELAAWLAESPLGRDSIPLLPGLAPGAAPDDPVAYALWVAEYDSPGAAELAGIPALAGPRVGVAMAAGDSTAEGALRTLESLRRQTYGNWELRLAARLRSAWPEEALAAAAAAEPRLRRLEPPGGATALAAWQWAALPDDGDGLVCLLEPGDTLPPTALHEVVSAFASQPDTQLLYTDEDVAQGGARCAPWFKPGYSPDLLLAGNSLGQLAVYRAGLLRRIAAPDQASAAATHDVTLRAAALAGPRAVRHLPAVLCHRAAPPRDWPSPAPDGEARARLAPGLHAVEPGRWPRPRFALPDPPPLVSVIVPMRDRAELLAACIAGLLERTDYPALELLVVDNGSEAPDALALLSRLEATPRVRVLRRPGAFNFAALNNDAAAEASGEVLLLLNNDTEVLHPDWLSEMVSHAVRPDVGIVGAKLLYPDRTVQHAGMLLGPAGAATHVGRHAPADAPGYAGQLACTRDLSCVTGACIALRRDVFHRVGGMEARLAVAWNDVDLCLRVRAAGLRVIWTPHAVLLHRESVTRGLEAADPARQARFEREQALVRETWGQTLDADPFLNPNLLATEAGPLVLTRPRTRRPWQEPDRTPPVPNR